MARRKKPPEHENHERWLVSYADFITLLFAFFVVMFATSQTDKGKAQQVSDSVKRALEGEKLSQVMAAILGGTVTDKGKGNAMMHGPGGAKPPAEEKKDQKLAELLPSLKILSEELKKEIDEGRIQISMQARGLVVSFNQAALFARAKKYRDENSCEVNSYDEFKQKIEEPGGCVQVGRFDNMVAPKNRYCSMAAQFHRSVLINAAPEHLFNRCPAQVVEE